jgi:Predicted Zn-dependent protease (DUF2268)
VRTCAVIVLVLCGLALEGCSGPATRDRSTGSPASPSPSPRVSAGGIAAHGRISVSLCRPCVRAARLVGVDLRSSVTATARRVGRHLPDLSTVVKVRANPGAIIPEVGVGGYTDVGTGEVTISLDPDFAGLRTTLRVWLPLTMAHELDHAQRTLHGPGYGRTLLQAMVSEGLADAFALEAYARAPAIPWDHALNRVEEYVLWRAARSRLGERQDSAGHALWFYGSGRLPRWTGYTIGFHIVQSYLRRHPGLTAARMVTMPAARILRGSRFAR